MIIYYSSGYSEQVANCNPAAVELGTSPLVITPVSVGNTEASFEYLDLAAFTGFDCANDGYCLLLSM